MPAGAAQNVRAQLLSIGATASDLEHITKSTIACLNNLRKARSTFDELALDNANEHSETCLTDLLQDPSDPLHCAATRAVEIMEASVQHLRLLDVCTDAAESSLNTLEHDLRRLASAVASDNTPIAAASALQIEATGVLSVCAAWIRLSTTLSAQLVTECELMQERLLDHARCRSLALSTLLVAQRQATPAL